MIEPLPLAIQTTYQDLLDRHRRRPHLSIEGSLIREDRSGQRYWVARQRIGDRVRATHIGPDNEDIRQRVEQAKREQDSLEAWKKEASLLVAQLRGARARSLDINTGKVISALARVGFFRAGGILAGTHAFALYEMELGVRFEGVVARTEDVDIMADRSVRIVVESTESMSAALQELDLKPVAGLNEPHPVRWESKDGTPIDLLTPRRRGSKDIVQLEGLGMYAQALPFLEFAIVKPIDAVALYREGVFVKIPAPERFAIHKLLVASERRGSFRAKSAKDLAQATILVEALAEQRPFELKSSYEDAKDRGPKWRKVLSASLEKRPSIADVLKQL